MKSAVRFGLALSSLVVSAFSLSGCHVSADKSNGKDNVSIETPLGGLNVKTDPTRVLGKVGLPQYPGSTAVQDDNKSDKDSADVDMSFGSFHLRVLAASFQTSDPASKVEDFYRKPLSQFSDVIACKDQKAVGAPAKTGLGLTCSDDNHVHTGSHTSVSSSELELKAGSPSRQHIVTLESRDGGTRIGLVALDLPRDSKDSD